LRVARRLAVLVLAVAIAAGAQVETTLAGDPPAPETATAPAEEEPTICSDRPTKANGTCTVPKDHWQIESDVAIWSHSDDNGAIADQLLAPNPTLKYGLTDHVDLEANIAPYEQLWTRVGNVKTSDTSVSDLLLRLKWEAVKQPAWSLAIIPFVTAPTARMPVGNGRWEGGVIIPITLNLPDKFELTFQPEIDVFENEALDGHHAEIANLADLSRPLNDRLTVYGEVWGAEDFDPAGRVSMASADVAAAYLVSKTLQLDLGADFGLTRATPRTVVYIGISKLFWR
jgi:hypothetical protein